jgi:hypothetical protein
MPIVELDRSVVREFGERKLLKNPLTDRENPANPPPLERPFGMFDTVRESPKRSSVNRSQPLDCSTCPATPSLTQSLRRSYISTCVFAPSVTTALLARVGSLRNTVSRMVLARSMTSSEPLHTKLASSPMANANIRVEFIKNTVQKAMKIGQI